MNLQAERIRPAAVRVNVRPSPWQANNLNALRVLAAFQVALHHTLAHFRYAEGSRFVYILSLFPGVPIFFFASGLLISRSLHRSSNITSYVRNRLLRLYPGLWVAFFVAFSLCLLAGFRQNISLARFAVWVFGQLSIVQFYNPHFMRAYGTGVLNGSLWTIAVEIQFYALLPALTNGFRSLQRGSFRRNGILAVTIAGFAIANRLFIDAGGQLSERPILKFLGVSFIPWFYMFLAGVLVEENFDVVHRLITRRRVLSFGLALTLLVAARPIVGWAVDNTVNPAVFCCLAVIVLTVSFGLRPICPSFQKKWDLSYGIYLFHMPAVNFFYYRGWTSSFLTVFWVMTMTVALALLSWRFVESRALQRKRLVHS